jgi:hypothetical protein
MRDTTKTVYDNLAFTHKVHEKQCEILSVASIVLRLVSVSLIVAVLFLQFWQFANPQTNRTLLVWSIILTVAEVGVAFFQLNFNYDKLLDQHRGTAKNCLLLKNRLLVAKSNHISSNELMKYVDEANKIYEAAPQTGQLAKWMANRKKN